MTMWLIQVTKQPLIKSMRVVKKETLKLIANWVERSNDPQVHLIQLLMILLFFMDGDDFVH